MARLGFELRAVVLDAVCGYGKLRVSCIQWRQQLAPEWTNTMTVATFAAAGVRVQTVAMQRCTRGEAEECYVLLGVHRAR